MRGSVETLTEMMTETASLKALARLVLERDSTRDEQRDTVSRGSIASVQPAAQLSRLLAASICDAEAGLEQRCATRRGRVVMLDNGAFLHFCCECGRFAAFGYSVRLTVGRFGRWYCGEHRPQVEGHDPLH